VLTEGVVYQYCSQSGLVAVEADTGRPLWELPEGLSLASRGGKRTCVLLSGNRLALLESTTGLVIGTLPMDRAALAPVNREGMAFYVVTTEGQATCYAPRDTRHLRPADLRSRGPVPASAPSGASSGDEPAEEAPLEAPKPSGEMDSDDPLRSRTDG
jgi:hypothetical protein